MYGTIEQRLSMVPFTFSVCCVGVVAGGGVGGCSVVAIVVSVYFASNRSSSSGVFSPSKFRTDYLLLLKEILCYY